MSPTASHDGDNSTTLKPRSRRTFEIGAGSSSSDPSPSPADCQASASPQANMDGSSTPIRTRSILNLTSSTLFGIYSPTGYATDREEASTPWGTGAETPAGSRRASIDLLKSSIPEAFANGGKGSVPKRRTALNRRQSHHVARKGFRGYYLPLLAKWAALFGVGILYGLLISHLQDRDGIAPVKVEGIDRSAWPYYIFWGTTAVLLGEALPHVDALWGQDSEDDRQSTRNGDRNRRVRVMGAWYDAFRSVGAFVGIAFAIRKLPWQSTLQLSLTLAMANPAMWYLVDRSPSGFTLSTVVAFMGTAILLGTNPDLLPSPSPAQLLHGSGAKHSAENSTVISARSSDDLILGMFSEESVAVATWIASVLFVSTVCFGNIGRRLAQEI